MSKKLKGGFTLIELLVVISIVALLSSVVLSSLGTARQKAKNSATKAGLVQWRTALNLYYTDNGGYPKTGAVGAGPICLGGPCYKYNGVEATIFANPVFRAAMDQYIRGTPNPNQDLVPISPTEVGGSIYTSNCSGTTCPTAKIEWMLFGDTSCGFGATKQIIHNNTWCDLDI
jgi:prepilin-type N-terminal cleavage/methylation domain-containing protein